jgi:hypothetical protein
MSTIEKRLEELNELIRQFRFHEALDKFYSEDVVTCENEAPPTIGLTAYRQGATNYLSSISNASAELKNVLISDGITVTEWRYIFDHKQWGHWDKVQVSVQRWKDGLIVHERHHYNS